MPTRRDVEDFLDRVVRCLRAEPSVQRVILFGSHAWGEASPDSDVDLFVVMDTDEGPFQRRLRLRRLLREDRPSVPFDLVVLTPDEVEQRIAIGDVFVERMLGEGRVLHRAG